MCSVLDALLENILPTKEAIRAILKSKFVFSSAFFYSVYFFFEARILAR